MKNADKFYEPIIKKDILISGIAFETIQKNSSGEISIKGFESSLQTNFSKMTNNLLSLFDLPESINQALIIIDNENSAKIYTKFPLLITTKIKGDIKKNTAVFKKDIFDISKIEFKDSIYEIQIKHDDKVIYLFRENWKFGLFYDFTQKIDIEELKKNLGHCYKRLFYYNLYSFVENKKNFNNLKVDGWFPFIRLIGKDFDTIMQYYEEEKKNDFQINDLISKFTKAKIESFTQYWWRKPLFKDKKEILEAGIDAFLQNNKKGFINCLNTLYPQIEGIMGIDYFNTNGKKPSFQELMEHIKQRAESKFNTASSMGFPNEIYEYLKETVFKNFDIVTGELDLSRHTTSHGYANKDDFNRAKSLQVILILDQIYFYL